MRIRIRQLSKRYRGGKYALRDVFQGWQYFSTLAQRALGLAGFDR